MAPIVTYIIPWSFSSKGTPMEYKIVHRILDRRTNFHKSHREYIVTSYQKVIDLAHIEELQVKEFEGRIIAPNLKKAKIFWALIHMYYGGLI